MKTDGQIFPLVSSRRLWLAYAGIVCLLGWFYFGDLRHHLLETHDADNFRDSARISQDWTFFFSLEKEQASGRLLYEFVSFLAFLAWGADPGWYHLLVVIWHVGVSLLLVRCCRAIGYNIELSMLTGLLFLVNVAHFRGIHWLSSLNYVMGLVFALLALLCFVQRCDTRRRLWLVGFYGSLILGALSHIASLMVWPFCFFWVCTQGRDLRRALYDLLPFALLLGPTLAVVFHFTSRRTSTMDAFHSYSASALVELILGFARSLFWLLSRLLSTAHWLPLRSSERQTWELFLGAALLGLVVYLVWRKPEPVSAWAIWTALLLLPFALLTEEIILDLHIGPSRYLYFASAGSCAILAWGLQRAGHLLGSWRRPIFACSVTAILAISYTGLKQAEGLTYYSEARSYLSTGDDPTGIRLMRKALQLGGEAVYREDAYTRLCLAQIAQPARDTADLAQARTEFPEHNAFAAIALVIQSMKKGDPDQAFSQLLSIGENAGVAELAGKAYYNIAKQFADDGNHERAALAYGRSLHFLPDRRNVLQRLAESLWASDQREQATSVLLYLVRLAPDDPDALYKAALAFNLQGQYQRAAEFCRRVLGLEDRADARQLLAASASAE